VTDLLYSRHRADTGVNESKPNQTYNTKLCEGGHNDEQATENTFIELDCHEGHSILIEHCTM